MAAIQASEQQQQLIAYQELKGRVEHFVSRDLMLLTLMFWYYQHVAAVKLVFYVVCYITFCSNLESNKP